jgi:hypothetical protein
MDAIMMTAKIEVQSRVKFTLDSADIHAAAA